MRHSQRMLKQIRRTLIECLVLSIGLHLLLLAVPLLAVEMFRLAVPQASIEALGLLAALAIAAIVAAAIVAATRHIMLARAGLWLDHELGHILLENGLKNGLPAADLAHHGALLAHLRTMLTGGATSAVLDAMSVPLIVAAIGLASPGLGLVAGTTALLLAAMIYGQSKPAARLLVAADEARDTLRRDWTIRASRSADCRTAGLATSAAAEWERMNRGFVAKAYGAATRLGRMSALTLAAGALGWLATCAIGAWSMIEGAADPSHVAAATFLTAALVLLMGRLANRAGDIAIGLDSFAKLEKLAAAAANRRTSKVFAGHASELAVTGAAFTYPGQPQPALRNIELVLLRGMCLAVTGAAGSGKSAIANLMAGAAAPTQGSATLDGIAITELIHAPGAPPIAFVADDPVLLDGTIADNIARFSPMSDAEVAAAAARAGVHDIIASLPQGYATPVGAMGRHVSSRLRRAVAFARAVATDPAFLVIDTPEQGLDAFETQRLQQVLVVLIASGTGVALATNDPSLLALADRVAVLNRGEIAAIDAARHAHPRRTAAPQSAHAWSTNLPIAAGF